MKDQLTVQLLASAEELLALAPECDAQARRMQPRLPFATSSWLLLWWQHYCESRLLVRDRFYVHTVRDAQGTLVAIAPLMLTERPGSGPFRARTLGFFGGDKNVTELRGLVCAPEAEGAAVRAVLAHFSEREQEWDWFNWYGVRAGSEAYAALSQAKNFHWIRETRDYVLPLPATWDEFRQGRSRNIKESLRKCYNSLKRAGHAFEFRVVDASADLPAALRRFFELHAARAAAPGQVAHSDVFSRPRAREFLLDLAQRPTEALSMRVFQLSIAGSVVASRVGFVQGDELYLYFSGYEQSWSAYSVMTTTLAESIKWAIQNRFRLLNLSPGTDVSKTRWGATAIETGNGVLVGSSRRSRAVFATLQELNERSRSGALAHLVGRARRLG